MVIPPISESIIEQNATDSSFSRGERYYQQGAVTDIVQRGNCIEAEVEGSEASPYRVTLQLDAAGITSTRCTCPYDYGGWCKHIVATAFTCVHEAARIESRPTLVQLLDRLDHVQTQRLVQALVAKHPNLIDLVDQQVLLMANPAPPHQTQQTQSRRSPIDTSVIRRQVEVIIRQGMRLLEYEYDYEGDPFSDQLLDIVDKAREFSQQGDGQSAIAILETMTATYADEWDDLLDCGGDGFSITDELNAAWTEAILCADLAQPEVIDLQVMLEEWQDQLDADFSMSLAALQQGWEDPALRQALQGQATPAGDEPPFARNLALIRLQILDRQDRQQEYLNLAQTAGLTLQYLTRLAELGHIDAALVAARDRMTSVDEAWALAKVLREREYLAEALAIAQAGLPLPGYHRHDLAHWTSELAEGMGQTDAAVQASITAFNLYPSFADYRRIQSLAPDQWQHHKPLLLQTLRAYPQWNAADAKVDIFLHEGLIDDAIRMVDTHLGYGSHVLHRVMTAAIPDQPDWVIGQATERAESIMNQGKADRYQDAVKWLQQVKIAYVQSDRSADWEHYFNRLKATHARKYKLMNLFQQLS